MKRKKQIIIISLFFAGLFLFGSCYTNKKGVVPCPSWGQTNTVDYQNIQLITD